MHDESHCPIEFFVFGKGAVAAFVGEDPDAGEYKALESGVCSPGEETEGIRGNQWDICCCQVEEDAGVEEIADDVGHAAEDGGLEAVSWDGVVDFFHGEVGEVEFLPVEIEVSSFIFGGIDCRGLHLGCW